LRFWDFPSSDQYLNQSWTSKECTILVKLTQPIVACNVSRNLSPIASQARDVLLFLLRSGNSIHQLLISNPPHTDSDIPRVGTFNNWLPALFKLCSTTTNTFTTLHIGHNSRGM
jgi:hypothetical protein